MLPRLCARKDVAGRDRTRQQTAFKWVAKLRFLYPNLLTSACVSRCKIYTEGQAAACPQYITWVHFPELSVKLLELQSLNEVGNWSTQHYSMWLIFLIYGG